jgi:hypothetical protein
MRCYADTKICLASCGEKPATLTYHFPVQQRHGQVEAAVQDAAGRASASQRATAAYRRARCVQKRPARLRLHNSYAASCRLTSLLFRFNRLVRCRPSFGLLPFRPFRL